MGSAQRQGLAQASLLLGMSALLQLAQAGYEDCYYRDLKCESDEPFCTESDDDCPTNEADNALHTDTCRAFSSGGSRMIKCSKSPWPLFFACVAFVGVVTWGVYYWKKQQVEFKTEMAHAQLSVGHPNAPTPEVVAVNGRSVEEQPPAAAAPYMPSVPAVPEGP